MSKLYEKYKYLKEQNNSTLYLFESGIFYIFLQDDARIISDVLSLKMANLNDNVVKCGFPKKSIDKYLKILEHCNYDVEIVNSNDTVYTPIEYKNNEKLTEIVQILSKTDTEKLSINEAYNLINNLKERALKINENE